MHRIILYIFGQFNTIKQTGEGQKMNHVLVVIPVNNEAESLQKLLFDFEHVAKSINTVQIYAIVFDDGSVDGSDNVAKANRFYEVIRVEFCNKAKVVQRGLVYALEHNYDAVIVFDGDGQHPPEAFPEMLKLLREYDIVKGTRFHEKSLQIGTPWDRQELNKQIRERISMLTNWSVTDPQCGLIGIKKCMIDSILRNLLWDMEWEIQLLFYLWKRYEHHKMQELPIPAIYSGLHSKKQEEKYQGGLAEARLKERLERQYYVIERCLNS